MTEPAFLRSQAVRPLALFGVAVTGVMVSALLGAVTNAVNGWVSPAYFVTILRWEGIENVWRATIAQGIFEGLIFGVIFSLIFTAGAGVITRAGCTYKFAIRYLLAVMGSAAMCWAIGGFAAIGLASLSPEFYQMAFRGVPLEFGPMLRYAWVGGSIWGVQFGGIVSVVLGLVVLRANWIRKERSEKPGTATAPVS